MNENTFSERLRESPGDLALLREFADWLIAHSDPRGDHLAAELEVQDAIQRVANVEADLARHRSTRSEDFDWLNVVYPMVATSPADGIFYAASAPDDPPFIEPGAFCNRDSVVGIVEAKKVFYAVTAGHSGVVTDVVVSNNQPVSFGDTIVRLIRPDKPTVAG